MLRIVKMTFEPEKTGEFLELFEKSKLRIRNFEGCSYLALLRDSRNDNVFFTYSIWELPEELENYRNSELFEEVWSKTKKMFQQKPEAWSLDNIITLP